MEEIMTQERVSAGTAAKRLGVNKKFVFKLIEQGILDAHDINKPLNSGRSQYRITV